MGAQTRLTDRDTQKSQNDKHGRFDSQPHLPRSNQELNSGKHRANNTVYEINMQDQI